MLRPSPAFLTLIFFLCGILFIKIPLYGQKEKDVEILNFDLKTFSQAVIEENLALNSTALTRDILYKDYRKQKEQQYPGQIVANARTVVGAQASPTSGSTNFGLTWNTNFLTGTSVSLGLSNQFNETTSVGGANTITVISGAPVVVVSQQLLRGGFFGKYNHRTLDTALYNARSSDAGYRFQVSATLLNALAVYHQYIVTQELISLYLEDLKDTQNILAFNRRRSRLGTLRQRDLVSSEILTIEVDRLIKDAKSRAEQLVNDMVILTGKNPNKKYKIIITDTISLKKPQLDLTQTLSEAIANREDYKQARILYQSAKNSRKIAKLSKLPALEIGVSASLFGVGDNFSASLQNIQPGNISNYNLTFSASLQAFTGWKWYRSVTESANLRAKQSAINLKQLEQTIEQQIHNTLIALDTNQDILNKNREIFRLTTSKYRLYRSDYQDGLIDFEEGIRVKRELIRAQLTFLNSKLAYQINLLEFYHLTGKLNTLYYDSSSLAHTKISNRRTVEK